MEKEEKIAGQRVCVDGESKVRRGEKRRGIGFNLLACGWEGIGGGEGMKSLHSLLEGGFADWGSLRRSGYFHDVLNLCCLHDSYNDQEALQVSIA